MNYQQRVVSHNIDVLNPIIIGFWVGYVDKLQKLILHELIECVLNDYMPLIFKKHIYNNKTHIAFSPLTFSQFFDTQEFSFSGLNVPLIIM